jgi:hypothetical protein
MNENLIQCQKCGYLIESVVYELPEGWEDNGGLWSCADCNADEHWKWNGPDAGYHETDAPIS